VSTRKWGPRHMNHAGHYWKWLVLSGMISGHLIGPERYRQIRYEDLVQDPESVLNSLCDWLGMGFEPGMLDYHKTAQAQITRKRRGPKSSVGLPVDRKLMHKWKQNISPRDHASIIRQAGSLLSYLDYDVPELSPRQRRDLARIETVLALEPAEILATNAPAPGKELAGLSGLLAARLVQSWCYLNGDYKNWAAAGIRWQQTVASLMR
ncbi:MAG: sulfotransferase, partial [Alphaproteobacteria bacterium]|nr:sulfotransferase [Alphaproteobacteria bacterium]